MTFSRYNEVKGDAWAMWKKGYHLCITTNGTIKNDGAIVTGAGIAQQATEKFPHFPMAIGQKVRELGNHVHYYGYRVWSFPVKHEWHQKGDIELIRRSFRQLVTLVQVHNIKRIYLPRPGCGNGQLVWEQVKKDLEESVTHMTFRGENRIWFITDLSVEQGRRI